jgi:hypothetical protein
MYMYYIIGASPLSDPVFNAATCMHAAGITIRAAKDGLAVKYSENDTSIAAGSTAVVVVVRSEDEGESHDRALLTMRAEDSGILLALQLQLRAAAEKVKVVVVTVSGGPVDTSQPTAAMGSGGIVTSVVAAWQPGEEGGNALAALLFADVEFSAALAVTAYKQQFAEAVAITNSSTAGRGYRYLTDKSLQLYPVGYGLSVHSKWAAPSLRWAGGGGNQQPRVLHAAELGTVRVVVTVKNIGTRAGSRPVLLFVQRKEEDAAAAAMAQGSTATTSTARTAINANSGTAVAAASGVNWPKKWLVGFGKAKAVGPGVVQAVGLSFGHEEMARWVPAAATESSSAAATSASDSAATAAGGEFVVVSGEYLLTAVDARGKTAASLLMTISN